MNRNFQAMCPLRRALTRARVLALALPLAAASLPAAAQAPIYESRDKAGPVFSDQPSPGAVQIDLPPPVVIQTTPPPAPSSAPAAQAPAYSALAIVSPANQGTFHSNTGAIDIRVQATPALRRGAGDRFRVRLDGQLVPRDFHRGAIHLTAADWSATAQPGTVSHTLAVAVVDRSGNVLIESQPVVFYVHHASVNRPH
ncbi:DUF4124 domain-containing protein [Variovorax sp. J22P168]|uniref:DUF4124 domain-containing protein n=1 Tax=Variovorax jilinensis TaxID=3053513 RepID=UPI002574EC40|nr:DUF4124 domain-containing protein [Variovorax sp. J22P168]MDM0014546.1 DUF4124 domain-containing protein [Variovorax sp. J22P168]